MKRKFLLILSLCLVVGCCALLITACQGSGDGKTNCSHDYKATTTQPTCTEQGFTTYTCSKCNDSYTENYINSLGHNLQSHEAKEVTCTEIGWDAYQTCSRCNYSTYNEIPALMAHNYENGNCKRCGEQEPTLDDLSFTLKNDSYEVKGIYVSITEAIIPSLYNGKFVTSIGASAFENCTLLTNILIPDSVTYIGGYAFKGCSSLTSITIPDSVTTIGINLFDGCSSLTSVTIGNGITSVVDSTFKNCTSLTSIAIPDGVTSIGGDAFAYCTSLTSITIPDGVTSIGLFAFNDCTSLTSIIIPDSVTSMDYLAFDDCSSLIIYCNHLAQPISWDNNWNPSKCPVIWNCKNNDVADNGYIYTIIDGIRYGLKDGNTEVLIQPKLISGEIIIPEKISYKNTEYAVTSIADNAFYGCTLLTSIVIPNCVTVIGSKAFYGCTSLTIYCETESKPSGWHSYWNYSSCSVVWGYKGEN